MTGLLSFAEVGDAKEALNNPAFVTPVKTGVQ
jgi:hypothetical protein